MTRDAREVERKKVGLRKARRRKQFSKRAKVTCKVRLEAIMKGRFVLVVVVPPIQLVEVTQLVNTKPLAGVEEGLVVAPNLQPRIAVIGRHRPQTDGANLQLVCRHELEAHTAGCGNIARWCPPHTRQRCLFPASTSLPPPSSSNG